jgi:hypothetical protein
MARAPRKAKVIKPAVAPVNVAADPAAAPVEREGDERTLVVKIMRGYVPANPDRKILGGAGITTDVNLSLEPGTIVELPYAEAARAVTLGIAQLDAPKFDV